MWSQIHHGRARAFDVHGTVDGSEIRRSPVDMVNIPMIYKVSCMLGGAGFLPSIVVH